MPKKDNKKDSNKKKRFNIYEELLEVSDISKRAEELQKDLKHKEPSKKETKKETKREKSGTKSKPKTKKLSSTDNELYLINELSHNMLHSILSDDRLTSTEKNILIIFLNEFKSKREKIKLNSIIKKYHFRRGTFFDNLSRLQINGYILKFAETKGTTVDLCFLNGLGTKNELSAAIEIDKNRFDSSLQILFLFSYFRDKSEVPKSVMNFISADNNSNSEFLQRLSSALLFAEENSENQNYLKVLIAALSSPDIDNLVKIYSDKTLKIAEYAKILYSGDFDEPSLNVLKEISDFLNAEGGNTRKELTEELKKKSEEIKKLRDSVLKANDL